MEDILTQTTLQLGLEGYIALYLDPAVGSRCLHWSLHVLWLVQIIHIFMLHDLYILYQKEKNYKNTEW